MGRLCGRGFDFLQLHKKKFTFFEKKFLKNLEIRKKIYIFALLNKTSKMDKILDSEFRQTLYKNLVDAGYDKKEAQKIVGVKYHSALKAELVGILKDNLQVIEEEAYDITFDADKLNGMVAELKKVKGVIE